MIRRKDEMEPVTRHELQKGMGDVTFHTCLLYTSDAADE